jgi:hypothetical protein
VSDVEGRTCTTTGLRLIPVTDAVGFHIARKTFAQPSAPWRSPDVHRQEWGRYDTLGRTYYLAGSAECAFAEVLAHLKRANGSEDPLAPIAAALDLTLEEAIQAIAEEWREDDFRGVGALPPSWCELRRMYRARITGGGWLIDIEHPDSIAALQGSPESGTVRFLASQGIPALTTGVLRSDNRFVTTILAEDIRHASLDDGTSARGIHFGSKHGGSWCRAIWLSDDGAADPGIELVEAADIAADDAAMRTVTRRLGLIG